MLRTVFTVPYKSLALIILIIILVYKFYTVDFELDDQNLDRTLEKSFAGSSNYHFSYRINRYHDFCFKNSKIQNLIVVHSAAEHFEARNLIRGTWGRRSILEKQFGSAILFFVGQPDNENIQHDLLKESKSHKDLIQAAFRDTYRNLTYKAVSWLRWINDYCSRCNLTFIVKVDDDIILNMENLQAFLNVRRSLNEKSTIYCRLWRNLTVFRNSNYRYFVEEKDFQGEVFPSYCSGSGYILTIDLIKSLYNQSLKTKFFWIDDIYVTGILVKDLSKSDFQIKQYDLSGRYILSQERLKDKFLKSHAIFVHYSGGVDVRRVLFQEIQNYKSEYRRKIMEKFDKHNVIKYADVAIKI